MAATPQNTPGFKGPGTLWGFLSAQVNQFFASKVDAEGGTADNINLTGTPLVNGLPIGLGPTIAEVVPPLFLLSGTLSLAYSGDFVLNGSGALALASEGEGFDVVPSIAALRLNTTPYPAVLVQGYYGPASAGGGIFTLSSAPPIDNGGTTIVDAAGHTYIRDFDGPMQAVWFGVVGNGVANDTTALQNAINVSFAAGINLEIGAGLICKVTAQLTVGALYTGANLVEGWSMSGGGPSQSIGGTRISLVGSGINAILQVNAQAYRNIEIADLWLECTTNLGATYGVLFNSTEYSNPTLRRVTVSSGPSNSEGPSIAYGVLAGTGSNGEFIHFDNCYGNNTNKFFYSNAPQAFQHYFEHCVVSVLAGGTYFHLDNMNGGFGLLVEHLNGTSGQTSGIANSTLLNDNGNTSTIKFVGGRLEHITCIYANAFTAAIAGGVVSFEAMEIGCDFDPTNGALTVVAPVVNGQQAGTINFDKMKIFADTANCTFPIKQGGTDSAAITFERSMFIDFAQQPTALSASAGLNSSLKFIDCRVNIQGDSNAIQRTGAFERRIVSQEFVPGVRSINGDSAWAPGGTPDQQIPNPQFANTNGATVTPISPWVASSPGTLLIEDWNGDAGQIPNNSSPFARRLVLAASQTLSITLTGIDLSSASIARYSNSGVSYSCLTWQLFVRQIASNTANNANAGATFSITDSVSGKVIDTQNYTGSGTTGPKLITLSRQYEIQASTSHPVLTIAAGSAGNLQIEIDWHYFSTQQQPSFNPVTAIGTLTQDIAVSTESLSVWSRFMLPHKSDSYGSTASNPLTNLVSDAYVSSTDGTLTWYNGSQWNKINPTGNFPEATFLNGGSAPTTGFSLTLAAKTTSLAPVGTLATGTIIMPAAPSNGLKLTVCSTQEVTALTVTPGAGQTVASAPTFLAQDVPVSFIYDLANTTWYPT